MSHQGERFRDVVNGYAAAIGAARLSDDEMDQLLALAKAAADESGDRRTAPITCYLAGLALAGEVDSASRSERVAAIARSLADATSVPEA
jgi:Domain of unknown function (DUF6457)